MIPMTLHEIAAIVGGRVAGATEPSTMVRGVCADSRAVMPGDLFVAIEGERTDGHDHAPAAVASGAVGVLGQRQTSAPGVVVDDSVMALGRLAAHVRSQLSGLTVIGLTGSSGKTTTKDLLAHLLPELGPTVAPQGSFNTEVGLPLTVLRADEQTRYLVLEMGMRGLGHIHYLCGIARPDVALVLNVGSAHQEMLGGIDGIAQAKGELVDALSGAGLAVLNGDDPRVLAMNQRSAAPIMTFGGSVASDVRATDIRLDEHARPSFTLHHHDQAIPVSLKLTGAHMVSNALGAAAVALSLGMHIATVGQLLSTAAPSSPWRMEVTSMADGTVVINDAYNANPESVTAALQALVAMSTSGTRWAILGEMRELGPDADSHHAEVGHRASTLGVDRVIVVGERARAMADALQSSAVKCDLVTDASTALEIVQADVRSGDIILVKASRAVGLESIASALLSGEQTASEGSRA